MTVAELLRSTGLRPSAPQSGRGFCSCNPSIETTLYRRECEICTLIHQNYPWPGSPRGQRLGLGQFMLITPTWTRYWGKHQFDSKNIISFPAAGMRSVLRNLILTPPEPPWMFIVFGRSNNANDLRITEDNNRIRIAGAGYKIRDYKISEIDRHLVQQMMAVGMSWSDWDTFFRAYADNTVLPVEIMRMLTAAYPALNSLRHLPDVNSAEYHGLKMVLEEGTNDV